MINTALIPRAGIFIKHVILASTYPGNGRSCVDFSESRDWVTSELFWKIPARVERKLSFFKKNFLRYSKSRKSFASPWWVKYFSKVSSKKNAKVLLIIIKAVAKLCWFILLAWAVFVHLFYLSQNIVITISKEFTVGYATLLSSKKVTADALNLLQMVANICHIIRLHY